jgi:hypothetical protein
VEELIKLAQKVLQGYFSAYEATDQRFEVVDVEWEPENFFKWARLDDYAAHRKAEVESRVAEIRRRHGG